MPSIVRVFFTALVLSSVTASAQERPDDPLRPLTTCAFGKDLQAKSVSRWTAGASRMVQTTGGPMSVSVADGYRMLLAFPGSAPFVNLKLERSQPGKLAADRTAILAQMTSFAATPGAKVAPFKVIERNGVEIMALNNAELTPGVISVYTLISEKTNVIATAYLLNQKPEQRKFQTFEQYQALRDEFIYSLAVCMAER